MKQIADDDEERRYIAECVRLRSWLESGSCVVCGAEPWTNVDCALCNEGHAFMTAQGTILSPP